MTNSGTMATSRHNPNQLAIAMYCLSIVFLTLLAALLVSLVDIPRVAELAAIEANTPNTKEALQTPTLKAEVQLGSDANANTDRSSDLMHTANKLGKWLLISLLIIWPLFWIELALRAKRSEFKPYSLKNLLHPLLICVIPPLRLGLPSQPHNYDIWLPGMQWQTPGRKLFLKLERGFSKPMLIIALFILPILGIEFLLKDVIDKNYWLRVVLHLSTGFIWFAFAFEFITMISASDKKFKYIKTHWLDLAIILFPFISFLRGVRVLRLARLAKLQKLAKAGRIYRMRGLGMKAFKAMLMLHLVQRILRITPEKTLSKLRLEYAEKAEDLDILKQEIAQLEKSILEQSMENTK